MGRGLYLVIMPVLFPLIAFAQPKIEIDDHKKSFGNVKQGDRVVLTYSITNAGNAPLVFERYDVTCSCTSANRKSQ